MVSTAIDDVFFKKEKMINNEKDKFEFEFEYKDFLYVPPMITNKTIWL
jgi:hypothetical protein